MICRFYDLIQNILPPGSAARKIVPVASCSTSYTPFHNYEAKPQRMWHASPDSKKLFKGDLHLAVIYIIFQLNEYYKVATTLWLAKWALANWRIPFCDMLQSRPGKSGRWRDTQNSVLMPVIVDPNTQDKVLGQ